MLSCLIVHKGRVLLALSCKHAISCQYRACTGPILPASAQYRSGTGTYWHVYEVSPCRLLYRRYISGYDCNQRVFKVSNRYPVNRPVPVQYWHIMAYLQGNDLNTSSSCLTICHAPPVASFINAIKLISSNFQKFQKPILR